MTKAQNMIKGTAKVRVVLTLPSLNDAEIGELFYDATNGKIALRLVSGYVYFTKDS